MLLRLLVAVAVSFAGLCQADRAVACQCGLPRDHEAARIHIMEKSKHVFAGRVISVKKHSRKGEAVSYPVIEARVQVVKQIKGTLPKEITITSMGGDTGGNCGFGDGLASAWATELPTAFALDDAVVENGKMRYYASGCTSGKFSVNMAD